MKLIKFNTNFYDSGALKYADGESYPATEETLRCVASGIAEAVADKAEQVTPAPKKK